MHHKIENPADFAFMLNVCTQFYQVAIHKVWSFDAFKVVLYLI